MAEIPLAVLQRRAPRPGVGQPAGTVGLPRQAAPAAGLAEAIGYAGRQVGQSLMGMAEVQLAVRQRAEAVQVQDHNARFTDDLLEVQQRLAVDQSIPPMELRARGEAERDRLLEQYSAALPARVRPKFLAEARQAAIQPLYTLDQVGVKRLGEQSQATYSYRSEQLQRQSLQSTTPLEQQQLLDQHDRLVDEYVGLGLVAPEQGPILKQKHRDGLAVTRMQTRISLDPAAAATQLEQGPDANADLPPEEYPKLLDAAQAAHQQQLHWKDISQQRADKAVEKAQEGNAATLRADMARLDPLPANTEKLRTLLAQTEQQYKDGKISKQEFDELTAIARSMLNKSLEPGQSKDNIALERQLTVDLARANTPAEIKAVQERLLNQADQLRPETIARLNSAVTQRLDATHYSNTKEYRDGVDIILRSRLVPQTLGLGLSTAQEDQRKLTLALDAYEQQMAQLAQQDVTAMKAQARDLAYRLRDLYLPAEDLKGVPAGVDKAPDEASLAKELERLKGEGVPERQLQDYRRLWRQRQEQRQEQQQQEQQPAPGRRSPRRP